MSNGIVYKKDGAETVVEVAAGIAPKVYAKRKIVRLNID